MDFVFKTRGMTKVRFTLSYTQMHPPIRPFYPTTPFERFLLTAKDDLIAYLLQFVNVCDVLSLGLLNLRMRHWYDAYRREVWNLVDFVELYVDRPNSLLAMMDGRNAMIYGASVLRFFLRCAIPTEELDICSTLSRFYGINRILMDDGYAIHHTPTGRPWRTSTYNVIRAILKEIDDVGARSWSLAADKSSDPREHLGFKFKYERYDGRRVNVHLVRCEPHRHVLATGMSECCFMGVYLVSSNQRPTQRR